MYSVQSDGKQHGKRTKILYPIEMLNLIKPHTALRPLLADSQLVVSLLKRYLKIGLSRVLHSLFAHNLNIKLNNGFSH